MVQASSKMQYGRAYASSLVSLELVAVSRKVGIQVMVDLCQRDLVGM